MKETITFNHIKAAGNDKISGGCRRPPCAGKDLLVVVFSDQEDILRSTFLIFVDGLGDNSLISLTKLSC